MMISGSGPLAGLGEACKVIFKEDGLRGFYRGCATNLLRTTPAAALTFTSFELIARALRKLSAPQEQQEQGLEDLPDYKQLQEQPQETQQQHQPPARLPLYGQQQQGAEQGGTLHRGQVTLHLPAGQSSQSQQQQQQSAPFMAHSRGAAQLAAEIQHMQRQRVNLSGATATATAAAAAAAAPGGDS